MQRYVHNTAVLLCVLIYSTPYCTIYTILYYTELHYTCRLITRDILRFLSLQLKMLQFMALRGILRLYCTVVVVVVVVVVVLILASILIPSPLVTILLYYIFYATLYCCNAHTELHYTTILYIHTLLCCSAVLHHTILQYMVQYYTILYYSLLSCPT